LSLYSQRKMTQSMMRKTGRAFAQAKFVFGFARQCRARHSIRRHESKAVIEMHEHNGDFKEW
jgi:hypothetical protein